MDQNLVFKDRLNNSEIQAQHKDIVEAEFIQNIFNSLPHIAAVINNQRQIIFSNQKLLDDLGIRSIQHVLGARPGEILSCENATIEKTGCGTSESCKYCGAYNTIIKSQKENKKVVSECTISSQINEETINYEFGIVVNPFEFKQVKYYILSLFDISDSKRRLFLEKIFFHDIMNKVGSLNGFLELIKVVSEPEKISEYIQILDTISQQLTKEIVYQKQLLEAENGTLAVNEEFIESTRFLESLVNQISSHKVAQEIKVKLRDDMPSFNFLSDSTLLGRIILNMLKNAVEASGKGDLVEVSCRKKEGLVLFEVNNPAYMTREIQAKIFKKSFSTKDAGRGLGTYSMKLLAEKYLNGKIYFQSTKEKGTSFYLEIQSKL